MISLKNISKRYGNNAVYEDFNLDIEKNKILVVLGESGSGKTTLLNILAGLTDFEGSIDELDKKVSMVFQKNRLIPNLTVEENLLLVNPKTDVDFWLDSVGLLKNKKSYPKALSAGMVRRVAILRALICENSLLLMDEPFVNLDLALKFSLIEKIKAVLKDKPCTVVVVTHDIKEAVAIADRIIVLSKGEKVADISQINENTEKQLFGIMMGLFSEN